MNFNFELIPKQQQRDPRHGTSFFGDFRSEEFEFQI